jgi:CRP/FNR family nitrogen fixation transcriptional regulator
LRQIKTAAPEFGNSDSIGVIVMLVRLAGKSRTSVGGQLAALTAERVTCSDFHYRSQTEIFGEGEPAEYVYQISKGAVRTYKLLSDGRRQINAFHLPGDLFGLENGEVHRFTAEAITNTSVTIASRRSLLGDIEHQRTSSLTRKNLLGLVTRNLQHAEDHMLLLGRKTSVERVAAFLLEMDQRMAAPSTMILPMNRRDIADYLGLTLETVSRALSVLRDQSLIRFTCPSQRELMLLDRVSLARLY